MVRLYAGENFPYPVVAGLRKLGQDVLTIQETGKGNQKILDADVLALATQTAGFLGLNRNGTNLPAFASVYPIMTAMLQKFSYVLSGLR
jgi:hypothetical protein